MKPKRRRSGNLNHWYGSTIDHNRHTLMATAKGKASKPTRRKSSATPPASSLPPGMKAVNSGYAPSWRPETIGEQLHGVVSDPVKVVQVKNGRKTEDRRVFELTNNADGSRHAIWESAALKELFDIVADRGEGAEVFIQYDGLGKRKAGQNPPKLFTTAVAE